MVLFAAVLFKDCYSLGMVMEMHMCAAVSVLFCYKAGNTEGNVDMSCS